MVDLVVVPPSVERKPELVTVGYGKHNTDIEASFSRIQQGGSWKKQRIVVIIPSTDDIPAKVALTHWSLIFPPNQAMYRILALGQEVGEAYSNAIQTVIDNPELSQWEYILTMECDNTPPADGLIQLLKSMEAHPEYACIGGLYWTKGEGGVPQIWGDPNDPVLNFRPQIPQYGKVVECNGTGMGFNLWRMSTFKDSRLRKPWFKTEYGAGGVGTQDLYFWGDAKKHGIRCAIDCNVLVGHYDKKTDINW